MFDGCSTDWRKQAIVFAPTNKKHNLLIFLCLRFKIILIEAFYVTRSRCKCYDLVTTPTDVRVSLATRAVRFLCCQTELWLRDSATREGWLQ